MKKRNYMAIVLRKELKDTFRDRKTLFVGLLMPMLLYPLLFTLMGRGISGSQKEAVTNTTVALAEAAALPEVQVFLEKELFQNDPGIILQQIDDPYKALLDGDVKLILGIQEQDAAALLNREQVSMQVTYNDSKANSSASLSVVSNYINNYNNMVVDQKLSELYGTSISELHPILFGTEIYNANIADGAENAGQGSQMLSMLIPMVLVIMLAVGSMASAVDMFAGEKERKTMEPLLTTRAGRNAILTGKFAAVSILGTLSTVLMLCGMTAGYILNPELLAMEDGGGGLNIPWPAAVLCLLLIVAVELSFSAIHVCLSAYARNVKEASTYGTVVMLAGMVPAYATMFMQSGDVPRWMMFVPILNVVGSLKMLLGGLTDYGMAALALAMSIVFLAAVLSFTVRMFHKEAVMLRM